MVANLSLLSHFQNDGATIEYVTASSPDSVSNSMLLELKRGGRKGKEIWHIRCSDLEGKKATKVSTTGRRSRCSVEDR